MAVVSAAASATMVATPCQLLSVAWCASAVAGTLVFKDGGASGTTLFTIYTPASAGAAGSFDIGGSGQQFGTDLYVGITAVVGVTISYQ